MVDGLLRHMKGTGHLESLQPPLVHEAAEFFRSGIHEEKSSETEENQLSIDSSYSEGNLAQSE